MARLLYCFNPNKTIVKLKFWNLILDVFRFKRRVVSQENELSLFLFVDREGKLVQEIFTKKNGNYVVSHKKINKVKDPFETWRSFEFK